ncbi:MAG: Fic family protein [Gemmatimonadetes bacterium]|nr:Fic family protein [Gemmatimonadota bacterium]
MRRFETTHPWLRSFDTDYLVHAPPRIWMILGEIKAKCEQLTGIPLMRQKADELYTVYLARGVLGTTAIEGNTLSEEDVRAHMEGKLKLPESKEYLKQEIDNILAEIRRMLSRRRRRKLPPWSTKEICRHNKVVLKDLELPDEETVPGEIRKHSVGVGRYRAVPAEDCNYLLEQLCKWLNSSNNDTNEDSRIPIGLVKAIAAHLYFAWIHPFGDGNGRTARLIEFRILIEADIPIPATLLPSNFYNQTRTEYARQLDRASQSGGKMDQFMEYAIRGFSEGLSEQLASIRSQHLQISWISYVHEQFQGMTGTAAKRRRNLVLALSEQDQPVPRSQIGEINPRIAREYANASQKMISRDLNYLIEMKLVERTIRGYRARKERMQAFLTSD